MIVVDASAVGSFLIPDESGPFAAFARDVCNHQSLHAPAHWSVEIASLIRKAMRRGRLTAEQAGAAAAVGDGISASLTISETPSVAALVANSEALGLSAYDTGYLLLARRLNAALLTGDGALGRAAKADGLHVLAS